MPRLDATRIAVWRELRVTVDDIARRLDRDLRDEWDISLAWFEVLAALQRHGGTARPVDLADDLRIPASSISRRLDRLEEEGWIARHRAPSNGAGAPAAAGLEAIDPTDGTAADPGDRRAQDAAGDPADRRAVEVELTRTGRRLWREMNVSFRRAVQFNFATHLDDDEVAALRAVLGLLEQARVGAPAADADRDGEGPTAVA